MSEQLPAQELTPCVMHIGKRMRSGYGWLQVKGRQVLAHRFAYCTANGIDLDQIKGIVIRHRCDNHACVNPDHLEPGSQADNLRDMTERNRRAVGEKVGTSKLTSEQVAEIKNKYMPRSRHANQYALAREYGVTQGQISMIINSKRWSHSHQGESK